MRSSQSGLTLVELLVALSLLGVLTLSCAASLRAILRAWEASVEWAVEQQTARGSLDWMTRRLRMAGLGTDGPAFLEASEDAVLFTSDLTSLPGPERHRFCLDARSAVLREQIGDDVSGTCSRGGPLNAPEGPRGVRVLRLRFTYFDKDNRVLAPLPLGPSELARIARVRVEVVFDRNRSGSLEPAEDLSVWGEATVRRER